MPRPLLRFRALGAALACLVQGAAASPQDPDLDFVNWETPHVSPICMTPDGTRLLAVNTPDNRLEVFDLVELAASGPGGEDVHVGAVPVGLDPVSVRAFDNTLAFVVNHVSDSVSIVNLDTGVVIHTLETADEPCDIVFSGVKAFVSCSQANKVQIFNLADLSATPKDLDICGEDPRALAVSPDGSKVYAAVFESGNKTTVLNANRVSDTSGPYGGQNPPPNDGTAFSPPVHGDNQGSEPEVAQIVRQDSSDKLWKDDNGQDWTPIVDLDRPSWTLLDHDLVVIDVASESVEYVDGLMNINMALAVKPDTGHVFVVGTEATNEVRFEPNLNGVFLRVQAAIVDPASGGRATTCEAEATTPVSVVDLNPALDYSSPSVPAAVRVQSLGDPRGIAWNGSGAVAYVTGLGSNNVIAIDGGGVRVGGLPVAVGEGPTGLVFDAARSQLYVLNKFSSSISIVGVDMGSGHLSGATVEEVSFFDPSPDSIKLGRRHLYDTHATSGPGHVSCGSCHVDARLDRLAWDLGDPQGEIIEVDVDLEHNTAGIDPLNFELIHPMKGPMTTQTLQDIIGHEPHHWRGDRAGIEGFNGAFQGLLGSGEQLDSEEMGEFEDFLATIHLPPNPYRSFDNSLPTSLPLPGHHATGHYNLPRGAPLPPGNAVLGRKDYRTVFFAPEGCDRCHSLPTGAGSPYGADSNGDNLLDAIPEGPQGEQHLRMINTVGGQPFSMKIPQLRNLHERTGFDTTIQTSTAGFGFFHDGVQPSLSQTARTNAGPGIQTDEQMANLVAFLLAFSGDTQPQGTRLVDPTPNDPFDMPQQSNPPAAWGPLGSFSQASHAAVGQQLTLTASPVKDSEEDLLLLDMIALADLERVGLVAKGRVLHPTRGWERRGWVHVADKDFDPDMVSEADIHLDALTALADTPGASLTFTVVPHESEVRIGIDRDRDGFLDFDEETAGKDPADPDDHP